MIKMSRKAKKAMAVALTAGMLASTAATPVMAATEGWKQNTKGWWYQNADGSYPANKWEKINGKWYYFDANGYMVNGWKSIGGKWYYFGGANDGAMKSGWQPLGGKWYYLGGAEDGSMKDGWFKDYTGQYSYAKPGDGDIYQNKWQQYEGEWFYLNKDGYMEQGGWITVGDKEYFLAADGAMQSDVIKVGDKTYYLGDANDGSMKTGTVNIDGVDYTFDAETGACTDEKAPVAAKKFDTKGNLIKETVEVEEIDGITAEVVNAISQYKEYGNVVMTGNDAVIKVKVTNNSKPVVNTAVTLTTKYEAGADIYEPVSYVSQTDSNGYASFVISVADEYSYFKDQTALNGATALYSFSATAVTSGETTTGKFAFATIENDGIKVDPDDTDNLVMSTNALEDDNAIAWTVGMDGETWISYVKSQQVSLTDEHKVTFAINPVISIPVGVGEKVVKPYNQEINESLSEYSVYENQEFWIKDVPAGLQYATLNFENIDISEHTKVVIQAYEAGSTSKTVGEAVTISGPSTQKNKNLGQQLPIQEEIAIDVKIEIISEGQVNDKQNGGLTIKDVTGIYKQEGTVDYETIDLTNAVTWEKTDIAYSLEKTLDFDDATEYLPADSKYLNSDYSYSYQVPVFPYVGNAVITVKDTNKKVLAYFTVPTVNEFNEASATEHNNVNVLEEGYNQAILVTKDEAFNSVGTITPNGNKVTVNSSETGVTAFRAKITLDNEEYDLTNNTINTSVHWSPIPAAAAEENDFYALSGQKIVVKAQLIDKAGNKVSKAEQGVTFSYGSIPIEEGNTVGTKVTAIKVDPHTDSEGCAELVVQATDEQALLKALSADSSNKDYDVVLSIGGETVETANLRWVTPGLSFTPAVDKTDATLSTLDGNVDVTDTYVATYLTKEAGSEWILGYKAIGETQDDDTADRYVSSIEGLKINLSQDGEATMVTEGMKNGAAKLSTTKAEGVKLTGEIDETSLVAGTDITFSVVTDVNGSTSTKSYKNVGEGTPFFEEEVSLTLPVLFGNVGTNVSIELPKGDNIDNTVTDDETVHVKLLDAYGNPIVGKKLTKVSIVYTYEDGTSDTEAVNVDDLGTTNSAGVVDVTVSRADGNVKDVKKAEIKAEYDNESATASISFVEAKGDFLLLNANYDDTAKQATLTFSQNINISNLKEGMISVINDTTKNAVGVSNVEVKNGNQVVVTFKSALKEDYTYTVTVVDGEDVNDDTIADYLCDKYGRTLDPNNTSVKLTVEDANLVASYDGEDTKKITFKVNNEAAVATQKILCVWDSEGNGNYAIVDGNVGFDTSEITDLEVTEVKCYYNGDVETVKLNDRVEAIAAAQETMNDLDVDEAADTISAQTYTGAGYIFLSKMGDDSTDWADYKAAEVTIVKDDDNIFECVLDLGTPGGEPVSSTGDNLSEANPDGNLELLLSNPLVTDVDATATVEVIYAHVLYPSVTRKVTYKVTLEDSSNGETADTIVFEAQ